MCSLNKTHGVSKVYKSNANIKFINVINSSFSPLLVEDLINPKNEMRCNPNNVTVKIYRDDDYVYYYKVNRTGSGGFDCLTLDGEITNLPSGCNG